MGKISQRDGEHNQMRFTGKNLGFGSKSELLKNNLSSLLSNVICGEKYTHIHTIRSKHQPKAWIDINFKTKFAYFSLKWTFISKLSFIWKKHPAGTLTLPNLKVFSE